jgi:hypothetical protein
MVDCHWKATLGIECFGCGFQRSMIALFEGNFIESILIFPAAIPLLITLFYTLLHLWFKFKNGARNIIVLFSLTAFLMITKFVLSHF